MGSELDTRLEELKAIFEKFLGGHKALPNKKATLKRRAGLEERLDVTI